MEYGIGVINYKHISYPVSLGGFLSHEEYHHSYNQHHTSCRHAHNNGDEELKELNIYVEPATVRGVGVNERLEYFV